MASSPLPTRNEDEEKSIELKPDSKETPAGNAEEAPKYNRRASVTDPSVASTTQWRMLDMSQLPTSIYKLSKEDRMRLYDQASKDFTVTTTNNNQYCEKVTGLPHSKIAGIMTPQSFLSDLSTILFLGTFQAFYFLPGVLTIYAIYLFLNNYCYSFYLFVIFYLLTLFYPHKEWTSLYYHYPFFNLFKYFSYRISYHPDTQKYLLKYYKKSHVLNKDNIDDPNEKIPQTLQIGVPHGVQPLSTTLSPILTPDIFGAKARGAGASIVLQLPILRSFFMWWGTVDVSKLTLLRHLSYGENIGLVPDGISGMFMYSDKTECVLLKKRKGVAKLALQTGCNVVPAYGFGNTTVYTPFFDPWGIMKRASKKLRMSLIGFRGRWGFTTIPKKVPLYYAIGKIVENKYAGKKIAKPTQEQIDEYHDRILDGIQQTFDIHKHIYGWSHKQLKFI